jgi:Tfp pilus assembly protein PilF
MAQQTSPQQTIRLEVRLYYDDGRQFTTVEGTPGVNSSTRGVGGEAAKIEASEAMQIRVQLQDGFGGVVDDRNPERDGRVVFNIRAPARSTARGMQATPSFRLRVFGPNIDEVMLEGIDPAHGERIVHVSLHRKKGENQPMAAPESLTTVSLARLQAPPKASKELEKGNNALKAGDLDSAARHFQSAIDIYPDYDQAYNNLGVVWIQKGTTEKARRAFERAVAINDRFARAYTNLAKLALMRQDHAEAEAFLRRSLQNEPQNPEALMLAAQSALFTGKLDDAINDVRILHTLPHGKYAFGHFIAARACEARSRNAEAAIEYELFLKEAPDSPNAPRARSALKRLKSLP